MAGLLETLCADLAAECAGLFDVLAPLDEATWNAPTSCVPWTIKDQVSHLAWNDEAAVRALTDPDGFRRSRPTTPEGIQRMVDQVIADHHDRPGADLLTWFRAAHTALLDAASGVDPKLRMPWYGPDMSVASKVTARFMETWAHGHDITDALGIAHRPTDRVRHVVFLGLQALPNAYAAQGKPAPDARVRLDLVAPSGESEEGGETGGGGGNSAAWQFGPPDAVNVVTGDAYELALVVTQRRHVADTGLRATGPVAEEWLSIAQAFAGPPGAGRPPSPR